MTVTTEEAIAALQALSEADRLRLLQYARWRVKGLGRAALGRTAEDLLGEACVRICEGRRGWSSDVVSFVTFMLGVIRSISSHWREQYCESEAHLASETRSDDTAIDPVENAPSTCPQIERVLAAKEQIKAINELFQCDTEVQLVVEGLGEGMTGPEIQKALGLSRNYYDAAIRRLRRGTRRLFGEGGQGHV